MQNVLCVNVRVSKPFSDMEFQLELHVVKKCVRGYRLFFLFCFFLKKEKPAQVGTPIHHTLLYAKMFYKMGLAFSYTYRATETEPTEHRIEKKKRKWGLNSPKTPLPQCKVN